MMVDVLKCAIISLACIFLLGIRPAVENCTVKPLPFLILLILLLLLLPLVRALFEPSCG